MTVNTLIKQKAYLDTFIRKYFGAVRDSEFQLAEEILDPGVFYRFVPTQFVKGFTNLIERKAVFMMSDPHGPVYEAAFGHCPTHQTLFYVLFFDYLEGYSGIGRFGFSGDENEIKADLKASLEQTYEVKERDLGELKGVWE